MNRLYAIMNCINIALAGEIITISLILVLFIIMCSRSVGRLRNQV